MDDEEKEENNWIINHTAELEAKFCFDRSEEFYEFAQEEYRNK